MHVCLDLFGSCESVLITSPMKAMTTSSNEGLDTNALAESMYSMVEDNSPVCSSNGCILYYGMACQ